MDNLLFLYFEYYIVLKKSGSQYRIPRYDEGKFLTGGDQAIDHGIVDHHSCYSFLLSEQPELSGEFELVRIRSLYDRIDGAMFWLAGKIYHLSHWERSSRYCGRCGGSTRRSDFERALVCENCHHTVYPRISPAIIISVTKEKQILLGRSDRFPGKMYSVLAGFADVGESLEACCEREVFEETGIRIKNIRYFGSQAWPFPDSLMIAFTAEYESGHLDIDREELTDAQWFHWDRLPEIPGKPSIARQLIDRFVSGVSD